MKHKLGIFTALILSLIFAGSAFAMPKTTPVKKAAAAKVGKTTTTKKSKKHHKKKSAKKSNTAPTKK